MDQRGDVVLDLGPETGHARHSEGSFVDRADGSVLFVFSRFDAGSHHDDGGASLVAVRSHDRGRTWTEPEVLLDRREENALNVMSVTLRRLQDGRLALWYLRRRSFADMRLMMRLSTDEGESWGEPRCCTPGLGYHVVNNDRVIQLASGRLLAPMAFHRAVEAADGTPTWAANSSWAVTYFSWSDDVGETWQESGPLVLPYPRTRSGLQEPGVIQLADGTLRAWARTDQGSQWEMGSRDGGETWTAPQPSPFASPESPMSMTRLRDDRLVAVWNPVAPGPGQPPPHTGWHGGRTPLVMSVGDRSGRLWSRQVVLEDDPDSGYCYTAIHELEDSLLVAYCAGSAVRDENCLVRLRVRRLPRP